MSEIETIRNDFIEGINEVFTSLFNDGEVEGLNLYKLSENTKPNIYGEEKYKHYQQPLRLVCQARLTPTQGEQDVEVIKDSAVFNVPYKSLKKRNLDLSNDGLDTLRQGVIEFNGVFYDIDNILPKAFVAGIFHIYEFQCTEKKYTKSINLGE